MDRFLSEKEKAEGLELLPRPTSVRGQLEQFKRRALSREDETPVLDWHDESCWPNEVIETYGRSEEFELPALETECYEDTQPRRLGENDASLQAGETAENSDGQTAAKRGSYFEVEEVQARPGERYPLRNRLMPRH